MILKYYCFSPRYNKTKRKNRDNENLGKSLVN